MLLATSVFGFHKQWMYSSVDHVRLNKNVATFIFSSICHAVCRVRFVILHKINKSKVNFWKGFIREMLDWLMSPPLGRLKKNWEGDRPVRRNFEICHRQKILQLKKRTLPVMWIFSLLPSLTKMHWLHIEKTYFII